MRITILICLHFLLTAGIALGQSLPNAIPDEIFYNGKVITVDSSFRIAEAFAVKGEQFLAVGGNAAMKALANPQTRLTDLGGLAVIPGLMDNHNHQYNAAVLQYRGVDLNGVRSVADILTRLRQAVSNAKPGEGVLTNNRWTESSLQEKRGPTRAELDAIASDRVIMVFRARGTAYLNSTALQRAGIGRETKIFKGIPVPMDATGEPTGQITGPSSVNAIARTVLPPPDLADQEEWILKAQQQQLALGLTGIREVELQPNAMRAYSELRRLGKLAIRVSMGVDVTSTDYRQIDAKLSPLGVVPGFGDHWLRFDSVSELALDTGAPTSWTREPHTDGSNSDIRITPDELREAALTVNRYGWRPAIHITGDKTLDAVLDAYEAADAQSSIRGKRWSVEHVPLVHPDQMERMARLGVVVSAQFQAYAGYDGMRRAWGSERASHAVPIKEFLDHHVVVSAGSDWPGETSNPFVPIYFYVTRKTTKGELAGPAEKISREEALRVSTVNNAYMTFEEDVKGSIEAGKLADFLVLSDDILSVPDEKILSIRPLATFVGGKKMYSSNEGGF